MTPLETYAATFLVFFCRIGTALILMPAFSSSRFPVMVRLLVALLLTGAIAGFLSHESANIAMQIDRNLLIQTVLIELFVGLLFGFWCQCFLHAARLAGAFTASAAGLAGMPGQPIDDPESVSQLSTLLSLMVIAIMFATDLHLVSLRALIDSYAMLPAGTLPDVVWTIDQTTQLLRDSAVLAVKMSSPIVVTVLVVNLALGICNRFTPQLQVYFSTLGLTILLCFFVLALATPTVLNVPIEAYRDWLIGGVL